MKVKLLTLLCIIAVTFLAACGKSDADLQKAVQEKFVAENISGVTVSVNGGVATLSGDITDITVKNRAEVAAGSVEGIKSVTNTIVVKAPPPSPPPADPMLKGKVETNLQKAGCSDVKIDVVEGKVVATGKAPDAKYAECIKVIQESGATGFENKIEKGS